MACRVGYSVNDWGSGFTGTVTITNTGAATINGWTLRFSFPGSQQLSNGWEATWSQSGAQVTAANAAWNGTIAPGGSVTFGMQASRPSGNTQTPTGLTCTSP